jgi:hypothetical protein
MVCSHSTNKMSLINPGVQQQATGWMAKELFQFLVQEIGFFFTEFWPAVVPTQPPMQWGLGDTFPWSKVARAWSWNLTFVWWRGCSCVDMHMHSPHMAHIVFSLLNVGTDWHFTLHVYLRWTGSFAPRHRAVVPNG